MVSFEIYKTTVFDSHQYIYITAIFVMTIYHENRFFKIFNFCFCKTKEIERSVISG